MQFNPLMLRAYLVGGTPNTNHSSQQLIDKVSLAIDAGITAFQYREKGNSTLTNDQRVKLGQELSLLCHGHQIPFLVDDDLELAFRCHANGIHVGQKDEQIQKVIAKTAGKLIIGYSCNTQAEILFANQLNAVDYIGAGPIFPTSSKADADPAIGLANLQRLNQLSQHPIVAIGGINQQNLAATLKTGVAGISTISMILDSDYLSQTIHLIRSAYH